MKHLYVLFIFCFYSVFGQKEPWKVVLQSNVNHFSAQEYGGHTQNWDICQGNNQFVYVANSKGLMEFNGIDWKIFSLPGQKIVRSVAVGAEGNIYTGGLGEFGFWKRDVNGLLNYFSLKDQIKDKEFPHEEIWKILVLKDQILFQSFGFMYSYKQNKVSKIKLPGPILFCFEAEGSVYAEVIGLGLYELKGSALEMVPNTQMLGQESICAILNGRTPGEIIIVGSSNVFAFQNKRLVTFNKGFNLEIRKAKINKAIRLSNGNYVFGTLLNGIYLTDGYGNILNHYNQLNGLQNNTVLSLFEASDRQLWVGLNSGIDLIHNLENTHYLDPNGDVGTVFDAIQYQNRFYIATNHGIYLLKNKHFNLIGNTQGHSLNFTIVNGQLYCGHSNGTYWIQNDKAKLISKITGGGKIKLLDKASDLYIQGTYTRLCIYQFINKKLTFIRSLEGFSDPVSDFICLDKNQILAKSATWGISKLLIDKDLMKIQTRKKLFHQSPANSLFSLNDINYIFTGSNFYTDQSPTHKIVRANNPFPQIIPSKIIQTNADEVIVFNQLGQGYVFSGNDSQLYNRLDLPEKEELNILKLNTNTYLVAGNEGFEIIDTRKKTGKIWDKPFVYSIQVFTNDSNYFIYPSLQTNALKEKLAYNENQLKFKIGLLHPSHQSKLYYKLWPIQNYWNEFTDYKGGIVLNKLPPGDYKIFIKSNKNAQLNYFSFSIKDPWYWSWFSKSIYLMIFIGAIWLAYKIHLYRLKLKQEEISKEMAYQIQINEERNKQEIIRLKNEKLEIDLHTKNEELSNLTFSIIKRNESLQKIKLDLDRIKPKEDQKNYIFNSIVHQIEDNFNSKKEWKIFEENFNEVHELFFKKLLSQFPDLSHGDLGLAAYLKMNLSSKEISQILNITPRSVELKRYRLRKKLALPTEQGLSEFLMNV